MSRDWGISIGEEGWEMGNGKWDNLVVSTSRSSNNPSVMKHVLVLF